MPGVGIEAFCPDYMHTLHLGVYQYVFGSVLILLTHFIMPRPRHKNLNAVWDAIKEYYKVVEPTNGNRNANFKTCSLALKLEENILQLIMYLIRNVFLFAKYNNAKYLHLFACDSVCKDQANN